MRIVASLSVCNDVEIIDAALDHLQRIGVDQVVACDVASTDGTQDILEQRARTDDLRLVHVTQDTSLETWNTRNLAALRDAEPDWVLFLDADERPLPRSGRLKDCEELAESDLLLIDRFNVVLGPTGAMFPDVAVPDTYDDVLLVTRTIRHFWKRPGVTWMEGRMVPKVIVRANRIAAIGLAAHDVRATPGPGLRQARPGSLLTAHLPFTTLARFRRKVEGIREKLSFHDETFGPGQAVHWRRWASLRGAAELEAEFERNRVDADALEQLRREDAVRSAAELFSER
jgi:hypothetical protein